MSLAAEPRPSPPSFVFLLKQPPQFVDIHLEEDDSSDEEYQPDEEEEDETAEEVSEAHCECRRKLGLIRMAALVTEYCHHSIEMMETRFSFLIISLL